MEWLSSPLLLWRLLRPSLTRSWCVEDCGFLTRGQAFGWRFEAGALPVDRVRFPTLRLQLLGAVAGAALVACGPRYETRPVPCPAPAAPNAHSAIAWQLEAGRPAVRGWVMTTGLRAPVQSRVEVRGV